MIWSGDQLAFWLEARWRTVNYGWTRIKVIFDLTNLDQIRATFVLVSGSPSRFSHFQRLLNIRLLLLVSGTVCLNTSDPHFRRARGCLPVPSENSSFLNLLYSAGAVIHIQWSLIGLDAIYIFACLLTIYFPVPLRIVGRVTVLCCVYCVCTDINECDDGNNGGCNVNAQCINTIGSRKCVCNIGYIGNGCRCEVTYI